MARQDRPAPGRAVLRGAARFVLQLDVDSVDPAVPLVGAITGTLGADRTGIEAGRPRGGQAGRSADAVAATAMARAVQSGSRSVSRQRFVSTCRRQGSRLPSAKGRVLKVARRAIGQSAAMACPLLLILPVCLAISIAAFTHLGTMLINA
jgi:hypothetical protein